MPPSSLTSVLRLAAPLAAVNLGTHLMGVVDTALAGRVSPEVQAATGLGASVTFFVSVFGMGIVMGVDPLTSQAFGASHPRRALRVMRHGRIVAGLLALPLGALILFTSQWLEGFGIDRPMAEATRDYVWARLPAIFPLLFVVAQRSYLQSAHRTTPIVLAIVVANLVNAWFDWFLCFGYPPLSIPALGVVGIGLSTLLATSLQAVILYIVVHDATDPAIDPDLCAHIVRIGFPIGLQLGAEVGLFTIVALLAGRMGDVTMAAHQVALMFVGLAFMLPLALGSATSVLVGRAIGSGDAAATRRAGLTGLGLCAGCMLATATAMGLCAESLARLMTDNPTVVVVASSLIRIAAGFQLFDGLQAVGSGALRGAGLTDWALCANLVAYWAVGLPVALMLAYGTELGAHGLWWGLTAGLAVAALALTTKFVRVSARPIGALEPGSSPGRSSAETPLSGA